MGFDEILSQKSPLFYAYDDAYGFLENRSLEQIEIIDIKPEEELLDSFSDLIYESHYRCFKSFFESPLATCPRRTIEYLFDVTMNCRWGSLEGKGFTKDMTFEQMKTILEPLLEEERNKKQDEMLSDPYVL